MKASILPTPVGGIFEVYDTIATWEYDTLMLVTIEAPKGVCKGTAVTFCKENLGIKMCTRSKL